MRKKILLLSIILCASLSALFFLIVIPIFQDIQAYSYKLLSAQNYLLELAEKRREFSVWQKDYPRLEPDLLKIQSLFVNQDVPIDFLKFLEREAQTQNVYIQINTASIKKYEKEEEDIPFLGLRVSFQGFGSDCLRFLEKIETAPYLIEIQELKSIKGADIKNKEGVSLSQGNASFDLLIRVFSNEGQS